MFGKIHCSFQFNGYEISTNEITEETLSKEYTKMVVKEKAFSEMVETFCSKEEDYVDKINIFNYFTQKSLVYAPVSKKYDDILGHTHYRCFIVSGEFKRFLDTEILKDNELQRVFFKNIVKYKPHIGDYYFDCIKNK